MTQSLVFTAVGTDRTGIVSEITKLTSEFGCNIVDSRMAVLGNEFTLIMLLNGKRSAINQVETRLPILAHSLGLLTISKRTSDHELKPISHYVDVEIVVLDKPGILKEIAHFFAKRKIDISSLRSDKEPKTKVATSNILVSITDSVDFEKLQTDFQKLCDKLAISGRMNITKSQNV